jgi:hypothetical protein
VADLAEFLAAAATEPFAWGRHDCCLWLGDWMSALGYADPTARFRGRYATQLGAARLLNRHGGVLGIVAAAACRCGLTPTHAPGAGDVGVVRVLTFDGEKPAGGICTGRRWAVLAPAGLIVGPWAVAAAWSVH